MYTDRRAFQCHNVWISKYNISHVVASFTNRCLRKAPCSCVGILAREALLFVHTNSALSKVVKKKLMEYCMPSKVSSSCQASTEKQVNCDRNQNYVYKFFV